jgi:hypothetical protein
MKTRIATKTLKLCWVDPTGSPFHEAILSPSLARELLKRSGVDVVRFAVGAVALRNLTYKAVAESSRGATAEDDRGNTVIIVLGTD